MTFDQWYGSEHCPVAAGDTPEDERVKRWLRQAWRAAEANKGEHMSEWKWISVGERLPEKAGWYPVLRSGDRPSPDMITFCPPSAWQTDRVTHWCELPPEPKPRRWVWEEESAKRLPKNQELYVTASGKISMRGDDFPCDPVTILRLVEKPE